LETTLGKSKRSDKIHTKEQKLLNDNKRLKQELSHLRKQIARLDNGRLDTLRQIAEDVEESQKFEEKINNINTDIESLKKEWKCHKCQEGILEIVLYSKLGLSYYYRKCNSCNNRTQGKRYGESVKGILKNEKY
jgi:hypothetical protein